MYLNIPNDVTSAARPSLQNHHIKINTSSVSNVKKMININDIITEQPFILISIVFFFGSMYHLIVLYKFLFQNVC